MLVNWNAQAASVNLELFYSTMPKCVSCSNENAVAVLLKPVGHLRQRSRLSDTIHATEDNRVRLVASYCRCHAAKDIDLVLRLQNALQSCRHRLFDGFVKRVERAELCASNRCLDTAADRLGNFDSHIFRDQLFAKVRDDLQEVLFVKLAGTNV